METWLVELRKRVGETFFTVEGKQNHPYADTGASKRRRLYYNGDARTTHVDVVVIGSDETLIEECRYFIATAPNNIRYLIDELEAARRERDAAVAALSVYQGGVAKNAPTPDGAVT